MPDMQNGAKFTRRVRGRNDAAPPPEPVPETPAPPPRPTTTKYKRTPEREIAIGARIRATRIAAQMSQSALGQAAGITFQQVQKYEQGRDRIAASTLQEFAVALDVHPGSFFDKDMPVPSGSIADFRATMRAAEVLQQVSNPRILKQLLKLAKVIADEENGENGSEPNVADPEGVLAMEGGTGSP